MKNRFMAEAAETRVSVDDLDLLADDDVPEDWEKGEDGWKGRFPVDDEERDVIDFQSVREIPDPGATLICVRDDNDFVASVYQFLCNVNAFSTIVVETAYRR